MAKIDVEGQVKDIIDHWQSENNEILSVCEDDFKKGRASSQKPSDGVEFGEREVPMVHSTTSSHYSVFRQRIPEYDLKEVAKEVKDTLEIVPVKDVETLLKAAGAVQ